MARLNDKELLQYLRDKKVSVEFSIDEVLFLHAIYVFNDGRERATKIIRKRITPVAIAFLKSEEYRRLEKEEVVEEACR